MWHPNNARWSDALIICFSLAQHVGVSVLLIDFNAAHEICCTWAAEWASGWDCGFDLKEKTRKKETEILTKGVVTLIVLC